MKRWLLIAAVVLAGAGCDTRTEPSPPAQARGGLRADLIDPALAGALATAASTDGLEVIVNYDERATSRDAVTTALLGLGAGVIQFKHLELVAALATPAEITAIAALPGVRSVYLNKQLTYYELLLH